MGNESNTSQEVQFVFRRLSEALRIGGKEVDARIWLAVLIPVLILGIAYVVWMYIRDSRSVSAGWAIFLGGLRIAVYLLLAWVFLLPAWQTWDRTENRSKVLLLLDVSGSMGSKDDIPSEAMPVEKLLTRQDKVIQFLTNEQIAFLKRLQDKNPITTYRFGGQLDGDYHVFSDGKQLSRAEWEAWLKPDPKLAMPENLTDEEQKKFANKRADLEVLVNSTKLADAVLTALNRESNAMLQGIVVVSDGRSTQGFSTQTLDEIQSRAEKSKIPIFTVVVGEHRQPINIRIADLQAPEQARPDDKFPVRVDVDGEGLAGQAVEVRLDVTKPNGEKITLEPLLKPGETAMFKPGEPPHAQVEFEIDKPEIEGEWKLVARVPADKREIFAGKEHVSETPTTVHVVKKPIRVLLFAGAPTRDYQFARTLFVREMDKKRAEVSIYLQLARPEIVQDVPPERLLTRFPTSFHAEDDPSDTPDTKYDNLGQYDVIIAFDPDWTQLSTEQLTLLEQWVGTHAGGLVLVAGPVSTFQLARGVNVDKIKPIIDLFPVFLEDSRLQGVGVERPTTEPWRLNFPGATSEMEFLKLDEESKEPLSGWEEFFSGAARGQSDKSQPPRRGFFNYYPVKGAKPNATVVATFSDPRARLTDGKEHPYLVTMPYGSGKVVFIGSGEMWRLRQLRPSGEVYHERFWTKLARYAGSGNLTKQNQHGIIVMGKTFTANNFVSVDARLFNRDMQPLDPRSRPKVEIKPPPGVTMAQHTFEMQAKPGQEKEATGWFTGRFLVTAAGNNYEVKLQVPGTADILSKKFDVKPSDPEMDNTMPDFGQMRQLASKATEVLGRVTDNEVRNRLQQVLERTNKLPTQNTLADKDAAARLYFDLNAAEIVPDCMITDRKTQRNRGPVRDVWDEGVIVRDGDPPWKLSYALLVVVGLLSVEWLTRKLLKLA
jgi:hypothetical protein